ncbi:sensor histidine kinase [Undibacterium sp. Ren11W]|uniref:sensor histidine kinase n=1 Tax=Undibacterium sp. Ren11W TaxID=3413045 RepID=UPI003BF3BC53
MRLEFNWRRCLPYRLRNQLLLFIGIAVTLAVLIVSTAFTYQSIKRERAQINENVDFLVKNIEAVSASLILSKDNEALEQILLMNAKFPLVDGILIVDTKNRVMSEVVKVDGFPEPIFSTTTIIPHLIDDALDTKTGKPAEADWFSVLLPPDVQLENWYPIQAGSWLASIRIRYSLTELHDRTVKQWQHTLLYALAAALGNFFVLVWMLRTPMRVLQQTTTFAEHLSEHIGEKTPVYHGTREFYALGSALNGLSEQLQYQGQALNEQAAHTQSILDNIVDGIVTIDTLGTIRSFNRAASRIFGYAQDEAISKNIRMLMPEPHRSAHDSYLKNYADGGTAKIIGKGREVEGMRKDGTLFAMDLAVSRALDHDEVIYIGVVRDISERHRLDRLKSEFVSTVSHELRTPLTSIHGSLRLLESGVVGTLPAAALKLVNLAQKNSQRLILLINDLLDMEKLAAGKMDLQLSMVDLLSIVKQSILDNGGYGLNYQVQYVLDAHPESCFVMADAARLQQVLANLLSNAAKFSGSSHQVNIQIILLDGKARVQIEDHGAGISEEFKGQIFGAFAQDNNGNTRKQGGTGLGLKITKSLVLAMQGEIGFDTKIGSGTIFWFDLPLAAPAA